MTHCSNSSADRAFDWESQDPGSIPQEVGFVRKENTTFSEIEREKNERQVKRERE